MWACAACGLPVAWKFTSWHLIVRRIPCGDSSTGNGFNSLVVGQLPICRLLAQVGADV